MKLHTKIFAGLVAGVAVGGVSKLAGVAWLSRLLVALAPLGTAFIRLVTMTVVPLVVASLFVGVASLGDVRRLGRIGSKTLAYFGATTLVAATIGLVVALTAHLGTGVVITDAAASTGPPADSAAAVPGMTQTLLAMVPQNPFAAAAQADLLPLIIAVALFAAAATVTRGDGRRAVVSFFTGVNDLCTVVIGWMMLLAPAAVFVLIASAVARSGAGLLASLTRFALIVVLGLALDAALVLLPTLRLGARVGVSTFLRATADALLLAFSTASSNAALPISISAARERLGISNQVTSFVLPAGTTLNKNGSAVYKAITAVFLAHIYGLTLGPAQWLTIVVVSTMAAFAGAGVPGSSLVTTLIVLDAIGLGPRAAAGIALVVAVDRPLDMCRSFVNTFSNLVGTALIARSEGEALVVTRDITSSGLVVTAERARP